MNRYESIEILNIDLRIKVDDWFPIKFFYNWIENYILTS